MRTQRSQLGFSMVEVVAVVVAVIVIAGAGYVLITRNKHNKSVASQPAAVTTPVAVPAAPEVKTTSDLKAAEQTLDATDIDAGTTDTNQLDTQLSGL